MLLLPFLLLPMLSGSDFSTSRNVGRRLSDFTLKTASGFPVRLYGFAKEKKKAVVLVFTGTACPVGDVYMPRLAELSARFGPKGVAFLAINSNAHESADDAATHAKEHGLPFPVLKDPKNLVADLALVERTPEVVVVDGRANIRYRGAIDDQYAVGGRKAGPSKNYLADALDAILAEKPVAVPSTEVAGCLIDRVDAEVAKIDAPRVRKAPADLAAARVELEKKDGPVAVGKVTFASDVAPIVQEKCQSCHRAGQAAPFALGSYDEARRWAASIVEVVEDRRMPPWHADPRHGQFANDRSLTPKQRATLLAWVEQGTPLGDPTKLPPPAKFSEGWSAGTPDLVVEMPEPYTVPAQGVIEYVNIRVPSHFKEDTWVRVAEAVPGDRSVLHHIVVYLDDHTGGRREHLCGYAPGDLPSIYPQGIAKKIPAGADFIFQLHYTPIGKVRTDRSKLGLTLARGPIEHQAYTLGIANPRFQIAPGDPNSEVQSTHTFKKDVVVLGFMPHMHYRGKDFTYAITPKDGPTEVVLSVPAYDFGWQSYYTLAKPLPLKAGSRVDCTAHYDNSKANPFNPDPTKTVSWGDQTFEEMMIGYVDYYDAEPAKVTPPATKADASNPAPGLAGSR